MARDLQDQLLFEIATEVANRVGGIYSVLKSKAPITCARFRHNYTLMGPLNPETVSYTHLDVYKRQIQVIKIQ